MAKVRFAAMVGAAAFSAGVALAAPLPTSVAHADGPDTAATAGGGSPDGGAAGTAHASRRSDVTHATAPKPDDGADAVVPDPVPHRGAHRAAVTPGDPSVGRTNESPAAPPHESAAVAALRGSSTGAHEVSPAAVAAIPAQPTVAATRLTAPASAVTIPATATGPLATAPAAATVVAATPVAAGPVGPTRSAPRALAVMTVTPGARANASSSASLIDSLLAPIRTIFGEGTALLVRRTFFNQAPSVTPVQLTGHSEGPITGTLGAVDPDGDALSFSITSNAQHGSAVVNGDGSYTYTPTTGFAGNDTFVVSVTDTGFHMNLLDLFRPASTSASVAVSQGASASKLRFQFVYGNGSQYWSSAARSALESAATQLSSYIVVTSPVTITYDVTGESSPFSSTLASAGSDFINDGSGFLQTVVQSKIQTGYDANGSTADGTIDWNFGRSWAFGSSVSTNDYDFQSTAMHELLHTLGFLTNIQQAGANTGRIWTLYDSYVGNAAGSRAIDSSNFSWNTALDPNLTGGNGGLYFSGPHAVAANYGNAVTLYTPSPWDSGSSLSHITASTLMNSNVAKGLGPRVLSPVELGILADIGYTVTGSGVPVLLFVGLIIRPRRRKECDR